MLSHSSLIGFVPTRDRKRAREFYQNLLGLKIVSDDQFATVFESNGSKIRVVDVREFTPAPFTLLGWEVINIREEVTALRAVGVNFQRYPWCDQDELDIWTAPGGSRVAWFLDPDGNVLSVSQHAP